MRRIGKRAFTPPVSGAAVGEATGNPVSREWTASQAVHLLTDLRFPGFVILLQQGEKLAELALDDQIAFADFAALGSANGFVEKIKGFRVSRRVPFPIGRGWRPR